MDARDRLIVALDVSSAAEAQKIVKALGNSATTYKIGKQLFTAEGPAIVRDLVESGQKVFLDLKFHDIPNTVAAAVRTAAGLGVSMLTVHASGGAKMLRAAADAAKQTKSPLLLLAVTVLTSLGDREMQEIGVLGRAADQVLRLAELARNNGCLGVVASPQEVKKLREMLGTGFAIVTPGVRPVGSDPGDQTRIATPADAIRNGATYLVVGRPITEAKDPARAARAILKQVEAASGQAKNK